MCYDANQEVNRMLKGNEQDTGNGKRLNSANPQMKSLNDQAHSEVKHAQSSIKRCNICE